MSNGSSIAHVTSVHNWFDTRIFHHECKTLAAHGYDVTLIAPRVADSSDSDVMLLEAPVAKSKLVRLVTSSFKLYRIVQNGAFEVVHVHDPELLPLALFLSQRGQRVIVDIHETLRATVGRKSYLGVFARLVAWVVDGFQRYVSRRVAAIIAATPDIARTVRADDVSVVANYPDISEFAQIPQASLEEYTQRQPSATYVGDLTSMRCIDELLNAASLVTIEDFRLTIAGRPTEIYPVTNDRITYVGVIDRPSVVKLLNSVRVGLCVLSDHPNYKDSRPIKVFEYLCAGLPVIVARTTRWAAHFVEETRCGIVVEGPDPQLIASAIDLIHSDPNAAFEMGRRGRAIVEQDFTWASQVPILLGVYKRVLNK